MKDGREQQLKVRIFPPMGSFKEYKTAGGGWVSTIFVTNCYEKYSYKKKRLYLILYTFNCLLFKTIQSCCTGQCEKFAV